jgi:hypothetical protein
MTRAYAYSGISTPEQAKGDGLTRQSKAEEVCKREGWILDDTLDLTADKVSAYKGKNAAVGKLSLFLEAVRTKRVPKGSVFIVDTLDRISRQALEVSNEILHGILKADVSIYVIRTGRHYTRKSINNPMELSELQWTFWLAHQESEQKSYRCKEAYVRLREKAVKGERIISSNAYGWLRPNEEKAEDATRFVVIPEAAKIIIKIYEWAAAGLGIYSIVRKLNASKVPTIARKRKNSTGKWTSMYVADLLNTRATRGEIQPHKMVDGKRVPTGEPIKGLAPAVVSEELWQRAQAGKASRKLGPGRKGKGRTSNNLFAGLLYSANDGTTLSVIQRGRDVVRLISQATKDGTASTPTFPYPAFEECLLGNLKELTPADLQETDGKDEIQAAIAGLTGRLGRLDNDIRIIDAEMESDTDDMLGLIQTKKTKIKQRAEVSSLLEEQRQRLHGGGACETLGDVQSVLSLLHSASEDERKELRDRLRGKLPALIQRIDVDLTPSSVKVRGRGRAKPTMAFVQIRFRTGTFTDIAILPTEQPNEYASMRPVQ